MLHYNPEHSRTFLHCVVALLYNMLHAKEARVEIYNSNIFFFLDETHMWNFFFFLRRQTDARAATLYFKTASINH